MTWNGSVISEILCQVGIAIAASFTAVCQASLSSSPVDRFQSHLFHKALDAVIGGLAAILSKQAAYPIYAICSASLLEEIFDFLAIGFFGFFLLFFPIQVIMVA